MHTHIQNRLLCLPELLQHIVKLPCAIIANSASYNLLEDFHGNFWDSLAL